MHWGDWVGLSVVLAVILMVIRDYRVGHLRIPLGMIRESKRWRFVYRFEDLGFRPTPWQRRWWYIRYLFGLHTLVWDPPRTRERLIPNFLASRAGRR